MLIQHWAESEPELEGFEDVWQEFRDIARAGIFTASDSKVRNLHAQFNMMLGHKVMQCTTISFTLKRAKTDAEIKKSELLHSKYNGKTVSANMAAVSIDPEYKQEMEAVMAAEQETIIADAEVKALEVAITALSRDLSARLKS